MGERASARAEVLARAASQIIIGNQSACETCPSRSCGFCSRLDLSTLETLARRSQFVDLAENARVPPGELVILTRGVLRMVQFGADGRRRILGISLPGDPVLPEEHKDGISIEAATDSTICRVQTASRQAAMAIGKDFRDQIVRIVRAKQDRARHLAVVLATLGPNERLISFLAFCTSFMPWEPMPGGGGVLTMQLDRQDLAALLGTTPETICRALHEFDQTGVIRMLDPRRFAIPDVARLRVHDCGSAVASAPPVVDRGTARTSMTPVNVAGRDAR